MSGLHPQKQPFLVFADSEGKIYDLPDLFAMAKGATGFILPPKEDFIPLPPGSELFMLPQRHPVGLDPSGEAVTLRENPYGEGSAWAVAAFIAPAHTQLGIAAYEEEDGASPLPLFSYTAVGWSEGRFWVTAFRSDPDPRQDPDGFEMKKIRSKTLRRLRSHPHNRLLQHLGWRCCLTYGCPAAKNLFLSRYEAPLPTSPHCNARCLGCISYQEGPIPVTQPRIEFVPTEEEIAEVAVPHLRKASKAIVSFGQGCEGEPLLQARRVEGAIRRIRSQTSRGTINLNSNASLPEEVGRLARAGLDSLRVTLPTARERYYRAYVRPQGFGLEEVRQSIRMMRGEGRFVSLNYFILPGFTDQEEEVEALLEILGEGVDFIQLRNFNVDPLWFMRSVGFQTSREGIGIKGLIRRVKETFPQIGFGYFNPAVRG